MPHDQGPLAAPDDVRLPPRFKVQRRLGEGGMGVVYDVLDTARGRRIALKTLRAFSPYALLRLKREFRALRDLVHPNLVSFDELHEEAGVWFFTMELVEGSDFVSWVTPWPTTSLAPSEVTIDRAFVDAPTMERANGASQGSVPRIAVRPTGDGPRFDEGRLRRALAQLTQGLVALHDSQRVHRDVKPSNVLVTPEGRVVVLDFGLVTDLDGDQITQIDAVGTPAYMAPEQAAGRRVGPEADWYAVGAVLFEALTGRLPFEGSSVEMMLAKQRGVAPSPRAVASWVPEDLDGLCAALLRFEPQDRPKGRDVLAAVSPSSAAPPRRRATTSLEASAFVGRRRELALLQEVHRGAKTGAHARAVLHGESGIGKTALVRELVARVLAEAPDTMVLWGRCYEREAVSFKAFDGIIDALTRQLAKEPDARVAELLPTRPTALARIFPVLRRVPLVAQAARAGEGGALDRVELRRRAFEALRELFVRLAERRSVVVVVDDFQWADRDSISLLYEVFRDPDPPRLSFVATWRTAGREPSLEEKNVMLDVFRGTVRLVQVAPLEGEDAREAVRRAVERIAPTLPVSYESLAAEARGHPLFIDEIVRHLALAGAPSDALRLEDALWARAKALEEPTLRVLCALSLANAPLAPEVVARALSLPQSDADRRLAELRIEHFARVVTAHRGDAFEPYHERIRAAVVAHVEPEAARRVHEQLAIALEAAGAEADVLARHWAEAGDAVVAARHSASAADSAMGSLAFDRAARLYREALSLRAESPDPWPQSDQCALLAKEGEALAMLGHGRQAGDAFLAASVLASTNASTAESLDLRRRAAEQFLRSGHFDAGLVEIRSVLSAVGLSYPATPLRALVWVVLFRVLLALRGYRFRERDQTLVQPRALIQIDVCWSVAFSLSMVDTIRSHYFQLEHFLLALRAGERTRIARAFTILVTSSGMEGTRVWPRTQALIARAQDMAAATNDAHASAAAKLTRAVAAYLNGHFLDALDAARAAEAGFRNETHGSAWETYTTRLFSLMSLAHLGRLRELCEEQRWTLSDATGRGDLHAEVNLRLGYANLVWLIADDPDRAERECEKAIARWSTRGFHLEHYYALLAEVNLDLYRGDGARAVERVDRAWSALRRSLILRVQFIRIVCRHMRARAALAALVTHASPKRGRGALDPRRLRARALEDAAAITHEGAPWAEPLALLARAGVATLDGDAALAARLLQSAEQSALVAKMDLFAKAAQWALAAHVGDLAAASRVERALAAEGVRNPVALLFVFAPGVLSRAQVPTLAHDDADEPSSDAAFGVR